MPDQHAQDTFKKQKQLFAHSEVVLNISTEDFLPETSEPDTLAEISVDSEGESQIHIPRFQLTLPVLSVAVTLTMQITFDSQLMETNIRQSFRS